MEMEYNNNAKVNGALATGIVGTALGAVNLLHNGYGLNGIASAANSPIGSAAVGAIASNMMHGNCKPEYITKEEFELQREIGDLKTQNAILQADQASENKMTEVYRQAHSEIAALREIVNANKDNQNAWNTSQSVANAQMSASIAANASSIAALSNSFGEVTKTVVPNTSVCPGWGVAMVNPVNPYGTCGNFGHERHGCCGGTTIS